MESEGGTQAGSATDLEAVDFHTHLLNPSVRFDRPLDRFVVPVFARRLGVDPARLKHAPYPTYTEAFAASLGTSRHVRRACLYPVDARYDESGREVHRDPTVCALTEDVLAVAGAHPGLFIPFCSVNPYRADALDRLDEYAEKGCLGAKSLQNYWGVDWNAPRHRPYLERLQRLSLPLTIHLGGEYSIDSDPVLEQLEQVRQPLEMGVTVTAAHMALGRWRHPFAPWRNLDADPTHFDPDYHRLLEWLEAWPNLYADMAAILLPLRARALRHLAGQTQIHHKLLFASDYPVPFTVAWNTHDLPLAERRKLAAIANPFDRYAATLLRYFPAQSPIWSNWRKLLAN